MRFVFSLMCIVMMLGCSQPKDKGVTPGSPIIGGVPISVQVRPIVDAQNSHMRHALVEFSGSPSQLHPPTITTLEFDMNGNSLASVVSFATTNAGALSDSTNGQYFVPYRMTVGSINAERYVVVRATLNGKHAWNAFVLRP